MTLVADESVDSAIISGLRLKGYTVYSISEESGGISDLHVLKIAFEKNCLLITEDKDFGELAFRMNFEHKGILLLRLSDLPRKERVVLAVGMVAKHFSRLADNFSVLNKNGIRIKTIR